MPIYEVTGPDGRTADVTTPEGATQDQAIAYAAANWSSIVAAAPTPKTGLLAALGKGTESTLSQLHSGVSGLFNPEEAAKAGVARGDALDKEYADQTSWKKVTDAYDKNGLLSAAGEVASQVPYALAEQAPNLATMAAGARLGALGGSFFGPAGTVIGGGLGALAASGMQQYGGNIERQAKVQADKKQPINIDVPAAGGAAVVQGGLDVLGTMIPLGGKIVSKLTGIPLERLLSRGAAETAKLADEKLLATVTKGLATGIAAEVPTEVAQQVLERAQAGLSLTDEDAMREYGQTAYQVGLLAPLGAAGRITEKAGARREVAGEKAKAAQAQADQEAQAKADADAQAAKPLLLGNQSDPLITFPDGSTARQSEINTHIANLPPELQKQARAEVMKWTNEAMGKQMVGMPPEGNLKPMEPRAPEASPTEQQAPINHQALADAAAAVEQRKQAAQAQTAQREQQFAEAQQAKDQAKQAELDALHAKASEDLGRKPDQQVAAALAATDETPTAMQLALQRAQDKTSPPPKARDVAQAPEAQQAKSQEQAPAPIRYSRATPAQIDDAHTGVSHALLELGQNKDLYQHPISQAKDLEQIAADKKMKVTNVRDSTQENADFAKGIEVQESPYGAEDPMGAEGRRNLARIMAERHDQGVKAWNVETNEGAHGTLTQDGDKVWVNVAGTGEGNRGSSIYDLAANYAKNNGLKFIGDPDGLSDAAMRRRLENMLSAAVKYQSTDFLEPHPRQLQGAPELGIPKLKWKNGDTAANIRSMVDASVASTERSNPIAVENIHYDPATQSFRDGEDNRLNAAELSGMLGFDERAPGAGGGGKTTVYRNALYRALLRSPQERRALLGLLHQQRDSGGQGTSGALAKSFYSKNSGVTQPSSVEKVRAAVRQLIGDRPLHNKLGRVVVATSEDIKSTWEPLIGKTQLESQDGAGHAQAFHDPNSNTVFLIADRIQAGDEGAIAAHELMHKHGRAVLGEGGWNALHRVIKGWEAAKQGTNERKVYDSAAASVKAVGEHLSSEELFPYAVEAAMKMGIKPDLQASRGTVAGWLGSVQQSLKTVWAKITGKPNTFNSQDLVNLAFGIAQRENPETAHATEGIGKTNAPAASAESAPQAMNTVADGAEKKPLQYSRSQIIGESKRSYSPEQEALFKRTGRTVDIPTMKERIAGWRQDFVKKTTQAIADQFAPVKDLTKHGYTLLRLSRGSAGAIEAFLQHGKLKISDGAYDADMSGGAIEKVFKPLQGEGDDFLWWVAAHRAEHLSKEDREHLFTEADIKAGKSLADGNVKFDYTLSNGVKTRSREAIYRDTLKKFDGFNKNALDMAEQSGLIDKDSRKYWEQEFYVPFYRAEDDAGTFAGANIKQGAVRQVAFKTLKGGSDKLHSDLLTNTLQNWGHLIDASAKNRAATAVLDAAEKQGIASSADEATVKAISKAGGGQPVWVMDNGTKRHYTVGDNYIATALQALEYAGMKGPLWKALAKPKHYLTMGVTMSPGFKIRNLIRDSIQAMSVSDLSLNPIKNIAQGIKASAHDSQTYVSALASGGLIRFGTMLEGNASDRVRQLIKMGVDKSNILDSEDKLAHMRNQAEKILMAYHELGNRGEEINRAALYEQLIKKGVSHAEASLAARDLLDFSMQGSAEFVRVITQVVPFMNARIQGLYKLGRAAKEDPARFGTVLLATAATSLYLLAQNHDDEDFKKLDDWQRDNFWWVKMGGVHYAIPKPFEIGSIATVAERGVELFTDKEMTKERFLKRVKELVLSNLSMNPTPQSVKPLIDIYANKSGFTGNPIESMGMEKLKPEYRFNANTSMTARGVSTAMNKVTGLADIDSLSPMAVDYAIQGYFGWLGSLAVGTADIMLRQITGQPTKPTMDYYKFATQGMANELPMNGSRYVTQLYDQAKIIEAAYNTWHELLKQGKVKEATEFFEGEKKNIVQYKMLEKVKAQMSVLTNQIHMIERSSIDPDLKKTRIQTIKAAQSKLAQVLSPH